MYRLTLYFLIGILLYSVVLSTLSFLSFNPLEILGSVVLTLTSSYASNKLFAKLFNATTNIESVLITALILSLIISPKLSANWTFLIGASIFAMAVKYFPVVEKRHVFNPAAGAVLAIALLSSEHTASWWVGTPLLFIPVLIGGLALVRKIRREDLFYSFLTTYVLLVGGFSFFRSGAISDIFTNLQSSFLKTSVLFFGTVMLTEPLTSPATKKMQKLYAIFVGILFATPQMRILGLILTPEQALIAGNIFSFFSTPNYRLSLHLLVNKRLSPDVHLFAFKPVDKFTFKPGQYMEWTLPHKNMDSRGSRRYFSLASSPTETTPMLLVKFYNPSSSYKKAMLPLFENQKIIATSLAGDFTLPKNKTKKLAFIAGGVGIAPFRSMIKYLLDTNETRDLVLIFINKQVEDILFSDLFTQAQAIGLRTHYVLTKTEAVPDNWTGEVGYVKDDTIQRLIPDYMSRTFYVSGPQLMVQNLEKTLRNIGVSRKKIKTDFFPGYTEKTG